MKDAGRGSHVVALLLGLVLSAGLVAALFDGMDHESATVISADRPVETPGAVGFTAELQAANEAPGSRLGIETEAPVPSSLAEELVPSRIIGCVTRWIDGEAMPRITIELKVSDRWAAIPLIEVRTDANGCFAFETPPEATWESVLVASTVVVPGRYVEHAYNLRDYVRLHVPAIVLDTGWTLHARILWSDGELATGAMVVSDAPKRSQYVLETDGFATLRDLPREVTTLRVYGRWIGRKGKVVSPEVDLVIPPEARVVDVHLVLPGTRPR